MIYEIFKTSFELSEDSFISWLSFILVSVYAVWFISWILGWVYVRSTAYVFDGKKEVDNPLQTVTNSFIGRGLQPLPDGWYSASYLDKYLDTVLAVHVYPYVRLVNNKVVEKSSERPESYTTNVSAYERKGVLFFKHWESDGFNVLGPGVLAVVFIIADAVPWLAIACGMYYILLRTARSIVRLSTKLTQHIGDKSLHKEVSND